MLTLTMKHGGLYHRLVTTYSGMSKHESETNACDLLWRTAEALFVIFLIVVFSVLLIHGLLISPIVMAIVFFFGDISLLSDGQLGAGTIGWVLWVLFAAGALCSLVPKPTAIPGVSTTATVVKSFFSKFCIKVNVR